MKRIILFFRTALVAGGSLFFLASCQFPQQGTTGSSTGNNAWGYNGYGNYGLYNGQGGSAAGNTGATTGTDNTGAYNQQDPYAQQGTGAYNNQGGYNNTQGGYNQGGYTQQGGYNQGGYTDPYANSGGYTQPSTNYPSDYNSYNQPATQPVPSTGGGYASRTYTVQGGDTLYSISRRYGTTVSGIRSANGISGDIIQPGQVLQIP